MSLLIFSYQLFEPSFWEKRRCFDVLDDLNALSGRPSKTVTGPQDSEKKEEPPSPKEDTESPSDASRGRWESAERENFSLSKLLESMENRRTFTNAQIKDLLEACEGKIDGVEEGNGTLRERVKVLQRAAGVPDDGTFGRKTFEALRSWNNSRMGQGEKERASYAQSQPQKPENPVIRTENGVQYCENGNVKILVSGVAGGATQVEFSQDDFKKLKRGKSISVNINGEATLVRRDGNEFFAYRQDEEVVRSSVLARDVSGRGQGRNTGLDERFGMRSNFTLADETIEQRKEEEFFAQIANNLSMIAPYKYRSSFLAVDSGGKQSIKYNDFTREILTPVIRKAKGFERDRYDIKKATLLLYDGVISFLRRKGEAELATTLQIQQDAYRAGESTSVEFGTQERKRGIVERAAFWKEKPEESIEETVDAPIDEIDRNTVSQGIEILQDMGVLTSENYQKVRAYLTDLGKQAIENGGQVSTEGGFLYKFLNGRKENDPFAVGAKIVQDLARDKSRQQDFYRLLEDIAQHGGVQGFSHTGKDIIPPANATTEVNPRDAMKYVVDKKGKWEVTVGGVAGFDGEVRKIERGREEHAYRSALEQMIPSAEASTIASQMRNQGHFERTIRDANGNETRVVKDGDAITVIKTETLPDGTKKTTEVTQIQKDRNAPRMFMISLRRNGETFGGVTPYAEAQARAARGEKPIATLTFGADGQWKVSDGVGIQAGANGTLQIPTGEIGGGAYLGASVDLGSATEIYGMGRLQGTLAQIQQNALRGIKDGALSPNYEVGIRQKEDGNRQWLLGAGFSWDKRGGSQEFLLSAQRSDAYYNQRLREVGGRVSQKIAEGNYAEKLAKSIQGNFSDADRATLAESLKKIAMNKSVGPEFFGTLDMIGMTYGVNGIQKYLAMTLRFVVGAELVRKIRVDEERTQGMVDNLMGLSIEERAKYRATQSLSLDELRIGNTGDYRFVPERFFDRANLADSRKRKDIKIFIDPALRGDIRFDTARGRFSLRGKELVPQVMTIPSPNGVTEYQVYFGNSAAAKAGDAYGAKNIGVGDFRLTWLSQEDRKSAEGGAIGNEAALFHNLRADFNDYWVHGGRAAFEAFEKQNPGQLIKKDIYGEVDPSDLLQKYLAEGKDKKLKDLIHNAQEKGLSDGKITDILVSQIMNRSRKDWGRMPFPQYKSFLERKAAGALSKMPRNSRPAITDKSDHKEFSGGIATIKTIRGYMKTPLDSVTIYHPNTFLSSDGKFNVTTGYYDACRNFIVFVQPRSTGSLTITEPVTEESVNLQLRMLGINIGAVVQPASFSSRTTRTEEFTPNPPGPPKPEQPEPIPPEEPRPPINPNPPGPPKPEQPQPIPPEEQRPSTNTNGITQTPVETNGLGDGTQGEESVYGDPTPVTQSLGDGTRTTEDVYGSVSTSPASTLTPSSNSVPSTLTPMSAQAAPRSTNPFDDHSL